MLVSLPADGMIAATKEGVRHVPLAALKKGIYTILPCK